MWGSNYGYPMMGGYGGGYGGFELFHVFAGIFWVVVLVAAIVLVVRLVRGKPMWRCHHHHGGYGALEILKERYAKGEIDHAAFEKMKKDIEA